VEWTVPQHPGPEAAPGLQGKDFVLAFVESYGRVTLDDPEYAPAIGGLLDHGTQRLKKAGFLRPQRLPDLVDVRRRELAGPTRRCSPGSGSTASSATARCWPAAG
jgi:hypothetical protein